MCSLNKYLYNTIRSTYNGVLHGVFLSLVSKFKAQSIILTRLYDHFILTTHVWMNLLADLSEIVNIWGELLLNSVF